MRLARAVARGEEVFEDLDAAVDWLKSPNASLGAQVNLEIGVFTLPPNIIYLR